MSMILKLMHAERIIDIVIGSIIALQILTKGWLSDLNQIRDCLQFCLHNILKTHFTTLFLIVGFSMKLWTIRTRKDRQLRYYWLTEIAVFVLIISDTLELWTQSNPDLRFFRTFFAVIGYILRPTVALRLFDALFPGQENPKYFRIPNFINCFVCMTAFFSPLVFSFDDDYHFTRGPLGFMPFLVSLIYLVSIIWITWKYYSQNDRSGKRFVLYLCAIAVIAAVVLDVTLETAFVYSAVMVSVVFLYMFLRSYDTSSDPLTKLSNRQSFYEDIIRYEKDITTVVSVDMNGLKSLNDKEGHLAGDKALRSIGEALNECSDKTAFAYRIGGDEFVMLFLHRNEDEVKDLISQLKKKISDAGYSVSVGYAMRFGKDETVEDMIRRSDEYMYFDKEKYYTNNIRDRRRRS